MHSVGLSHTVSEFAIVHKARHIGRAVLADKKILRATDSICRVLRCLGRDELLHLSLIHHYILETYRILFMTREHIAS